MTQEKPSSAYPDPMSPLLALIVRGALEAYQSALSKAQGTIDLDAGARIHLLAKRDSLSSLANRTQVEM